MSEPSIRSLVLERFELREEDLPHRADVIRYAKDWRRRPRVMMVKLIKALIAKEQT